MKPMVIFILLVFVFLVYLLFILKLTVGVSYTLSNNTQKLVMTFYFFRRRLTKSLQLYPKRVVDKKDREKNIRSNFIRKLDKVKAKLKEQSKNLNPNEIIKLINDLKQLYFKKTRYILRKAIVILDFKLRLEEGTGDASHTALLYGFLWNIVGVITSLLFNEFKTENKHIDIKTNFNEKTIKADFNCILSVKIGNIILVGIIFLKWLIKNIKGGDKFVKSSNRRTYDNCNAKHQGNG